MVFLWQQNKLRLYTNKETVDKLYIIIDNIIKYYAAIESKTLHQYTLIREGRRNKRREREREEEMVALNF